MWCVCVCDVWCVCGVSVWCVCVVCVCDVYVYVCVVCSEETREAAAACDVSPDAHLPANSPSPCKEDDDEVLEHHEESTTIHRKDSKSNRKGKLIRKRRSKNALVNKQNIM